MPKPTVTTAIETAVKSASWRRDATATVSEGNRGEEQDPHPRAAADPVHEPMPTCTSSAPRAGAPSSSADAARALGIDGTVEPGDVVALTVEHASGVEVSQNDPIVASIPL